MIASYTRVISNSFSFSFVLTNALGSSLSRARLPEHFRQTQRENQKGAEGSFFPVGAFVSGFDKIPVSPL